MMRILLIDDQRIFCESLKFLLEKDTDIRVVGTAYDGNTGMASAVSLRPDIVVMDIMMPDVSGFDLITDIKSAVTAVKVLILTGSTEGNLLEKAIEHGADGYILKDIAPTDLNIAIKGVLSGLEVIAKNVHHPSNPKNREKHPDQDGGCFINIGPSLIHLTKRDLKILQMIVDGQPAGQMAKELYLAEGRVRNLITELVAKLDAHDKTQLAVFALRHGLVD